MSDQQPYPQGQPQYGQQGPEQYQGPPYEGQPEREHWNAQDWRLLLITIAGTLAANLGTIMMVGLGLAYLHWRQQQGDYSAQAITLISLCLLVVFAAAVVGVIVLSRSVTAKRLQPFKWFAWFLAAALAVATLFWLLVLVGVASGTK